MTPESSGIPPLQEADERISSGKSYLIAVQEEGG